MTPTALSVWERFHRTLDAMAHDDMETVQWLRDTCPRVPEELPDPAYRDLVDGTERWVMVVAMDLLPLLARIEVLQDLEPLMRPRSPNGQGRRRSGTLLSRDLLHRVRRQLLTQLRSFWDALNTVCATLLETDARTVLQAEYPPLLEQLDRYAAQWETIPRDDTDYATRVDLLAALWLRFCEPPALPRHTRH